MATFHLSVKSGTKGKATNHARYITRQGKHGMNEDQSDLIDTFHGNLPDWAHDNPLALWKMADKHERANGATYREYEIALPKELTIEQHKELIHEFIQSEIGEKPFQVAIHAPTAALGGIPQPHAHVMTSDRISDGIDRPPAQVFKRFNRANPELGGCKKDSGGKDRIKLREALITTRETLANIINAALEQHGHEVRVDHRSNKERGIERAPERHIGQFCIKKMSTEDKAIFKENRQSNQKPSAQAERIANMNE